MFYNGLGTADAAGGAAKPSGKRCCYDTGSQTNNIFALHIGAVPEELVNDTVAMLVASIRDRNAAHPHAKPNDNDDAPLPAAATAPVEPDPLLPPHWVQSGPPAPPFGPGAHMDCGIFGTTFIFEVLHKHGADGAAIDMLTETSYPSFGRMIEQGATTLWESWNGDRYTIGSTGTSRNHIMVRPTLSRAPEQSFADLFAQMSRGCAAVWGWRQPFHRGSSRRPHRRHGTARQPLRHRLARAGCRAVALCNANAWTRRHEPPNTAGKTHDYCW